MPAWSLVGRGALVVSLAVPAAAAAQTPVPAPVPPSRISMADAVRLALEHNHQLRAQRLNVDISKADEITAALKPNPVLTSTNENFPLFSPSQLFSWRQLRQQPELRRVAQLPVRARRQAREAHRWSRATRRTSPRRRPPTPSGSCASRPSRRSSTCCWRSRRSIWRSEDLKNFSNVVDVNRERLRAGDLAEADFYKISLQKLQFEQDVVGRGGRARPGQGGAAAERRVRERCAEDFDVDGDLAYTKYSVDARRSQARGAGDAARSARRAKRRQARAGHAGARATATARATSTGDVEYDRAGPLNARRLRRLDRPAVPRSQSGQHRAQQGRGRARRPRREAHARARCSPTSSTPTPRSRPARRSSRSISPAISIRRKQSLDITTYVYQHGSGTLLDLLDAERTYRDDAAGVPPGAGGVHDQRAANQPRGRKAGDAMRTRRLASSRAATLSACGGGSRRRGAGRRKRPPRRRPRAAGGGAAPAGYFTVPADQLPHLKIVPVRKTTWATTVRTTGTVDWDNDHTTQAITQVSGPITRIVVDTGTRVKAGDPLLYVASADITNAISAYRKAKNRFDLAQRNLDRSKDLLEHKALSQRDFESAQADYNDAVDRPADGAAGAEDLRRHARRRSPRPSSRTSRIRPELAMRAPIAGTVVQKMVLPGQFIQAGTTAAFVISNTSTVWVQGHVYDKDLRVGARRRQGGRAQRVVPADVPRRRSRTSATCSIRRRARRRCASSRRIPTACSRRICSSTSSIHDKTTRDVLVVPTAAVLYDEQNFPFVYVQVAAGQVRAAAASRSAASRATRRRSSSGLKEGDRGRLAGQRVPAVREQLPAVSRHDQPHRLVRPRRSASSSSWRCSCLAVWGVVSFQNLPIDAYPDLSPPRVQIVTQWPGHAAEEVERLITIPLEVEMNGIPKLDALRSISLYGLSSVHDELSSTTPIRTSRASRRSSACRTRRCRRA